MTTDRSGPSVQQTTGSSNHIWFSVSRAPALGQPSKLCFPSTDSMSLLLRISTTAKHIEKLVDFTVKPFFETDLCFFLLLPSRGWLCNLAFCQPTARPSPDH